MRHICGLWSYDLNKRTINNTKNIVEIENMSGIMSKNMEYASSIAKGMSDEIVEPAGKDDLMGEVLKDIRLKLKGSLV